MTPTENRAVLAEMTDALYAADRLYWPSPFWADLNRTQSRQLEELGIHNFKRTINMRYFNWDLKGIVAHQLAPVLGAWLKRPNAASVLAAFRGGSGELSRDQGALGRLAAPLSTRAYALYLQLLADYVQRDDPRELLRIGEPSLGNPLTIDRDGVAVSQDLCNSVHELYSATRGSEAGAFPSRVAELGAGYGRLAYVFLKASKTTSYTILDIPPALFVSQTYLTELFPEEKVFRFRPFTRFEDVREEFESARLRFLGAHQIELLPKASFDLFVNISSLHEMTREQIAGYLEQIGRLTKGHFYTKQWRHSRALANGFRIAEDAYPIPKAWSKVFHERHPIQRMFFHALYGV